MELQPKYLVNDFYISLVLQEKIWYSLHQKLWLDNCILRRHLSTNVEANILPSNPEKKKKKKKKEKARERKSQTKKCLFNKFLITHLN